MADLDIYVRFVASYKKRLQDEPLVIPEQYLNCGALLTSRGKRLVKQGILRYICAFRSLVEEKVTGRAPFSP